MSSEFNNSQRIFCDRESVIIQVFDQSGQCGVGESSPLPGHSTEMLSDCLFNVSRLKSRFPKQIVSPSETEAFLTETPSLQFAWETALLDLMSRRKGISVASYLGEPQCPEIPLSVVVQSEGEAAQRYSQGYRNLKVKVGKEGLAEEELALIHRLRTRFGEQITLRLDANGAWSCAQAHEKLRKFAVFRPEFVEQPVSAMALPKLGVCAVPWAADESLSSPQLADSLLSEPVCTAFVVKPAVLGFFRARQLALQAHAQGLGVVVSHALDGPIGLAAACELALSLPFTTLACGLAPHLGLSAWPQIAIAQLEKGPLVTRSGRTGLGFTKEGIPWN